MVNSKQQIENNSSDDEEDLKNVKIHVEIMIDDMPIVAKEFLFDLKDNDLIFKSDKKQMEGGFIGPLLASLIPLGVDLFTGLLQRGRGIYGNGFLEGNGINPKDLKKNIHEVKIFDKKNKTLIKKFKTNPLGGALLSDPKFFKKLLSLENEIKGKGLYAAGVSAGNGLYAAGTCGGSIGSNQFINN
jgi:hypothetical protein